MNWTRFATTYTTLRPSPLLNDLPQLADSAHDTESPGPDEDAASDLRQRLSQQSAQEQLETLLDLVRAHVAATLGHATPEEVSDDRGFLTAGFDSLTAVELRNRLRTATGLPLPTTLIFDHPTPVAVVRHLQASLCPEGAAADGGHEAGGQDDQRGDRAIRDAIASIPVARLRQAGLLNSLLALTEQGDSAAVPPQQGSAQEIDEMDVDGLIQIAMGDSPS